MQTFEILCLAQFFFITESDALKSHDKRGQNFKQAQTLEHYRSYLFDEIILTYYLLNFA